MKKHITRTYWDYKIVEEVLDYMDFELVVSENEDGEMILKLHDLQGANLANIESEEFVDFDDVMDRLSGAYFDDYILRPLEETFENIEWDTCKEFYDKLMALPQIEIEDYLWDINVLGLFGGVYE